MNGTLGGYLTMDGYGLNFNFGVEGIVNMACLVHVRQKSFRSGACSLQESPQAAVSENNDTGQGSIDIGYEMIRWCKGIRFWRGQYRGA